MLISTLLAVAALAGSDPDGVVNTAPATPQPAMDGAAPVAPTAEGAARSQTPHGLTTDQQIQRWLGDGEAEARLDSRAAEAQAPDRMRAELSVGVGTGGYRDYGVAVSGPIGENGWLGLSYRQVENGHVPWGYRYDPYLDSSGYAFPGRWRPDAALEYEGRVARPAGPPWGEGRLLPQRVDPR